MVVTKEQGRVLPTTCAEQEERLILVYVVAGVSMGLSSFLIGSFLDRFGKFTITTICMQLSTTIETHYYQSHAQFVSLL